MCLLGKALGRASGDPEHSLGSATKYLCGPDTWPRLSEHRVPQLYDWHADTCPAYSEALGASKEIEWNVSYESIQTLL